MKNTIKINGNYYLLSKEEINEGDWYLYRGYTNDYNEVIRATDVVGFHKTTVELCSKIIASTDNLVGIYQINKDEIDDLLHNFIEKDFLVNLARRKSDETYQSFTEIERKQGYRLGYPEGYIQAVTDNQDKQFTLQDMILCAEYVRVSSQSLPNEKTSTFIDDYMRLTQSQSEFHIDLEMNEDGLTPIVIDGFLKVILIR